MKQKKIGVLVKMLPDPIFATEEEIKLMDMDIKKQQKGLKKRREWWLKNHGKILNYLKSLEAQNENKNKNTKKN